MPKPKPTSAESFPPVDIKQWPTHCIRCRKAFVREDRIITVFIVAGVGFDSQTNRFLPAAGEEYELAHLDCADPKMQGRVITVS